MYVYSDEWAEIRDRLGLTEDEFLAANACHQREADRLIADVDAAEAAEYLQTMDKLVMSTPLVCEFCDAGLSHQQSLIQTFRMAGITQERIAQRLGNATGDG